MGTNGLPQLGARVRVHRATGRKADLLGFADLVIADAFVIKDIRILASKQGGKEEFISFPAKKGEGDQEGKYFELAHPITAEARVRAREAVLRAYREAAGGSPA